MEIFTHRGFVLLTVCFLWQGSLKGQDSTTTIILSPRVGAEIDQKERDYFRLFGQIVGFQRAVIIQRPDSTYVLHVIFQPDKDNIRDTMIVFPHVQVLMLAEKINHFEGLQNGTYQMGTDPPRLTTLDGRTVAKSPSRDLTSNSSQRIPRYIDQLPLVPDSIDEGLFDDDGGTWIGLGVSSYAPNYSGLTPLYLALEENLATQGYPVAHRVPSFSSSAVFSLSLRLRLSAGTSLLLEGGTDLGDGVNFNSASASLLYCFTISRDRLSHPFAGVGAGHYRIRTEEKYLSPIGGGATLDALLIDASNFGYSVIIGFEGGRKILWSLSASYLYVPVVKQTKWGAEGSIDMSSFVLAARLSFAW